MAVSKVILNGTTLIDTTDKTVTNASMLSGVTALKNDGTTATGNIASKSSTDLTVSGATVTAPAGYYASDASKSVSTMTLPSATTSGSPSGYSQQGAIGRSTSTQYLNIPTGYNPNGRFYKISAVPNGTAGTPTATKGTVSNHSISVTPSVTNTTGYITGSTISGTAVTVSASELVSGTRTIAGSGTFDVTNYYTATVARGTATTPETTITANPTISVSSGGLITASVSGSKSVTPNVSAGYVSSGTAGTVSVSGSNTEQLTTQAATTYHPSTTDQNIASGKYLTGAQTIKAVTTTNLTAANIKKDVVVKVGDSTDDDCVTSVTGTYEGSGGYDEATIKKFIERTGDFTSFTFPSGITRVGRYAFAYCTSLQISELPSTITSIETYAFYSCFYLTATSLPSGITSIGPNAFEGCKRLALTSLPSGITQICGAAFRGCEALALTSLPSGVTNIGPNAFENCYALTLTTLPSSVTTIGTGTFLCCDHITSISCDGEITSMSTSNFCGSSSHPMALTSASFPNMKISALYYNFGNSTAANACQQLTFADIGKTASLQANAFANCYKLQTLVLRKTESICTMASSGLFANTPMSGYNGLTGTVYVPNDLISTYQTATNWSTLYNNGTVTFVKIEGSAYDLS